MNSAKLEDTRLVYINLLPFHTQIINNQRENFFKKSVKITSKRINCLGVNLTKEVKDLYSENYKILMKEIEDDKNNANLSHALGLEELMLLKWPYHPKQSTDLMGFLSNYPWHFS